MFIYWYLFVIEITYHTVQMQDTGGGAINTAPAWYLHPFCIWCHTSLDLQVVIVEIYVIIMKVNGITKEINLSNKVTIM